jgi:hypothetical protein
VVATVTFTFCELVPSRVTEAGETEQVAFDGAPEQASATVSLNPLIGVTLIA